MAWRKRQFVCYTEKGPKYWRYELNERTHLLRTYSGKNPTTWKPREKQFNDAAAAETHLRRTVNKKFRDGFMRAHDRDAVTHGETLFYTVAPDNSTSDAMDLHPDGSVLVVGTTKQHAYGASIYTIDLKTFERKQIFDLPSEQNQTFMHSVLYNETGETLFYQINEDTYELDLASGESTQLASYNEFRTSNFNPHVLRNQTDREHRRLLFYDSGNTIKVREAGKVIFSTQIESDDTECQSGALSEDGSMLTLYIVSKRFEQERELGNQHSTSLVQIWDIDTGEIRRETSMYPLKLSRANITPDKSSIIASKEYVDGPALFDLETGQKLFHARDYFGSRWDVCYNWAFAPDGLTVAYGARGVRLLHTHTKHKTSPDCESHQRVYRTGFSKDGSILFTAGDQGVIEMFKWAPEEVESQTITDATAEELARVQLLQLLGNVDEPLLLHAFATDCAQRAYQHAAALGLTSEPTHHDAIKQKRSWLTTQDTEALKAAADKARDAIPGKEPFNPTNEEERSAGAAQRAAFWAAYVSSTPDQGARVAAENASAEALHVFAQSESALAQAEQEWQVIRLQWWLSFLQHTRRLWLAYDATPPIAIPEEATLAWPLPTS